MEWNQRPERYLNPTCFIIFCASLSSGLTINFAFMPAGIKSHRAWIIVKPRQILSFCAEKMITLLATEHVCHWVVEFKGCFAIVMCLQRRTIFRAGFVLKMTAIRWGSRIILFYSSRWLWSCPNCRSSRWSHVYYHIVLHFQKAFWETCTCVCVR